MNCVGVNSGSVEFCRIPKFALQTLDVLLVLLIHIMLVLVIFFVLTFKFMILYLLVNRYNPIFYIKFKNTSTHIKLVKLNYTYNFVSGKIISIGMFQAHLGEGEGTKLCPLSLQMLGHETDISQVSLSPLSSII